MRRILSSSAAVLCTALLLAAAPQEESKVPADVQSAFKQLTTQAFRAHLAYLSDDLLEGRGTATRGHELAAKYVAAQFEALGLKPAGDDGTYFQRVPLRETVTVPEQCAVEVTRNGHKRTLKFGEDFISRALDTTEESEIEAPVVFVGYGISAPQLGHDDYAGVDVRGKTVATFFGAPERFSAEQRAHLASPREKTLAAGQHGVVGVILLSTPDMEKMLPWSRRMSAVAFPTMRWLEQNGEPHDAWKEIRGSTALAPAASAMLFEGTPKTFDQALADAKAGKVGSFALPVTARLRNTGHSRTVSSPNVAAILRGSDPKLKDEYVVYTAHLDHLGIGQPINGDNIYNGTADDASGSAALLVLARAFAAMPKPPARSILFVAVTAEEKGLLGSDYFAHFPTVPKQSMVADLNMDGCAIFYQFNDVIPMGAEHSSLGPLVQSDAARLGLKISPDAHPEQVFFIRSDQYSFVKQGIPSVFLNEGEEAKDPKFDARKFNEDWIRTRYHAPSDDMSQPMDLNAAVQFMQLEMLLGYDIANAPQRPMWNKGDFFGQLYASGTATQ